MAKKLVGVLRRKAKELRLEKDADALGIDVLVFSPKEIQWRSKRIRGYLYSKGSWSETESTFPAAVYNRIYTSEIKLAAKLEKAIGENTVFNSVTWFDKWEVYTALRKTKAASALPETMLYSLDGLKKMLARYRKIIVKPRRGQFGKGVCRIEASESGYELYQNLSIPKFVEADLEEFLAKAGRFFTGKSYILQQFIPFARYNGRIFDIRLYVQKNGRGQWAVAGGFSRLAVAGAYLTNQSSELVGIQEMLTRRRAINARQYEEMKKLGMVVAKALEKSMGHLGEVCVDFCVDTSGSIWIIEVNGHTQKKLLWRLGDANLERIRSYNPLAYAQHLAITKNAYPN